MLIVKFEDFIQNQQDVMKKVYAFIGVEEKTTSKLNYANPSGKIKYVVLHKFMKKASMIIRILRVNKMISNSKILTRLFYKYKNWNREVNNDQTETLSLQDEQRLYRYYKEDIFELEKITGQKFTDWLKFN
ncbi:hypothetical protein FVB9532_00990 [Mesonia oceanica]|mgnify:FL=1|uniref:Uncharacterized protein n=4 Tax=Mesonia TaxID=232115 RepID=A0AC61Y5G3_9FLAO|nr:hypothetical protein FVB9532_00990 [Mesonia oceanica]|tara:strand:- start:711 stop:1103 length:393 start_codon:yes stop_codon:yes gene_type:complete